MKIGNKQFDFDNNVYIMGILNVTPDSFSDGGKWSDVDKALYQVEKMILEGADMIDVGGESTRPGYEKVSDEVEIERVVPVIEKINERFDVVISIDTYKSKVAKAAVDGGASLVNDIWGLKADKDMAKVIADTQVACCLMHNRDIKNNPYVEFLADIKSDLQDSISLAKDAGISDDKIMIDLGFGFAKNLNQNLNLLNNCHLYKDMGYPILLGTSRKSMIGLTLDLPVEERLEGTIATTVLGVVKGCNIIRVHDVKENFRAIKMAKAILDA